MKFKDLVKRYRAIKPDKIWIKKSQAQFLAYFKEKFPLIRKPIFGFLFYLRPIIVSLVILLMIIVSGIKIFVEAKASLPGQTLYPLKRLTEKIVYQLMPAERKTLYRAEMVEKRLTETKTIVEKVGLKDSEVPLEIKEATKELGKEIVALKKEITHQPVGNDFPIQDNKKIVEVIKEKDLEKLLAETKEAIKEKNISAALEKINQFEEVFFEKPIEETDSEIKTQEEKTEEPVKEIGKEIKEEKELPKIQKSDFKTDLEKEEGSFKTDLIKE
ncbi:MAG: hypothetical protein ACK413_02930 [Patescibacteria group bacterium]